MIIFHLIILRIRNVSDRIVGKIKHSYFVQQLC
jgi:hypothetical protein